MQKKTRMEDAVCDHHQDAGRGFNRTAYMYKQVYIYPATLPPARAQRRSMRLIMRYISDALPVHIATAYLQQKLNRDCKGKVRTEKKAVVFALAAKSPKYLPWRLLYTHHITSIYTHTQRAETEIPRFHHSEKALSPERPCSTGEPWWNLPFSAFTV